MRYRLSEMSDRDFGAALDREMDRRLDEYLYEKFESEDDTDADDPDVELDTVTQLDHSMTVNRHECCK